jgi:hypothetical protein
MGVLYMPFFDVSDSEHGLSSITLSTAGESDIVINLSTITSNDENSQASSIFTHFLHSDIESFDPESVIRFAHYARTDYVTALEVAIRAAMTTATWPSPSGFNCDFSLVTGLVTLSYTQTFGVSWATNWNNALMLGFTTPNGSFQPTVLSGASSYTGQASPTFCINSTLSDVSWESGVYEPEGLGNHVINDTGGGNSIARTPAPQFNDWTQEFESYHKTYRVSAHYLVSPTATWTHQDLFRHCRKGFPFVLYGDDRVGVNTGAGEIYSLRSDGMSFHPQRATPGSGTQFHIPYRCHLEGIAS